MPARFQVTKRKNTNNWQLRFYVPKDCRGNAGAAEIWRSLGTSDRTLADERALDVAKDLSLKIKGSRKPNSIPTARTYFEPTDEQIEAAVREVYEMEVSSDLEERADPEHISLMSMSGKKISKRYRNETKDLKKAVAEGDFSVADIRYWSEHFGFEFREGSPKKARFHQALAYAYIEAALRWAEHAIGVRGKQPAIRELRARKERPEVEAPSPNSDMARPGAPTGRGFTIGELWHAHERQRGAAVRPATLVGRKISVMLFAEFVGKDRAVTEITKAHAREWREKLYVYPTMAAQRSAYKGKSFNEVIEINFSVGGAALSQRTVAKHLSALSTFFRWLSVEGHVQGNVFDGLAPYIKSKMKTRAAFSDAQLVQFFGSPLFVGCAGTRDIGSYATPGPVRVNDWRFWLPIMSAYTAARLGELAQLEVRDIRRVDGIHCLDINTDGEDGKALKSDWSRRLVPLHSELLKAGVLDYIEQIAAAGSHRLFPELERSGQGTFTYASKWFGKYLRHLQFEPNAKGQVPVFHSFRHSAVTKMGLGHSDAEIQPLVGHEPSTTLKGYRESATYSIAKRKSIIELIKYEGLDLQRLKD